MPSLNGWDLERYRAILREHAIDAGMHIGTREDPSDIVQETIIRALSSQDAVQADAHGQRIAWLLRIQKNVFIDKLREHHADKRDIALEAARQHLDDSTAAWIDKVEASQTGPGSQAGNNEERSLLQTEIEELPEREREVMRLHLNERLSAAEIALRLNISKGSVAGLIARASARLAAALQTRTGNL